MSTTATTAPAKAALPNEGRPGYKHTKLGWIPEEWEITRLGAVSSIHSGGTPSKDVLEYWDGGIPWYTARDLKTDQLSDSVHTVTNLGASNGSRVIEAGTILLLVRGMMLMKDIPCGITTVRSCFNQDIKALVVKDHIDREYLLRWIKGFKYHLMSRVATSSHGTGNLPTEELEDFPVACPPLPEQRRIAAVLGAWDRAIATVQQLLAAQQERKRGLMQELLTGKRRFPGFRGKWKAVPFDKVFTPKKEVAGEGDYQVLSVTTNGLVLQADYFNRDVASTDRSNYLVVRKGDFVFSGLNFWMGSVDMVWDFDEGIISPAYKCFTINEDQMLLDFARHFIRSHVMLMALVKCSIQGASIVRRNLDKELLEAWPFKLPSIPEQRKIADALNAMTDTIQALEQELDHLITQKRGLMQQLLTGAVRVKC